jgi:hypothetical protein
MAESVGQWAVDWMAGIQFLAEAKRGFPYSIVSRPALGPTQTSIWWIPGDKAANV